jgi:hypothetical protein
MAGSGSLRAGSNSLMMLGTAALLSTVEAWAAPQQITWFYSRSLAQGAQLLTFLGFAEVNGTKQHGTCRIFHTSAKASTFLGVCDSRAAAHCPHGPEDSPIPVTFTLVVPSIREVDAWHDHILALGSRVANATTPSHSPRFGCYAFNFYDVNRTHGLGCYRFEVQAFQDPAWPPPPKGETDQSEQSRDTLAMY